MKRVLPFIMIGVWLLSCDVFATELSTSAQCNQQAAKTPINKPLLKQVCLSAAKQAEADKNYNNASWYYLLAGKLEYLFSDIATHSDPKTSTVLYANMGHAYMLAGDSQHTEKYYQQFLKITEVPWANTATQDDYKILQQRYPDKKIALEHGLTQWKRLYALYQQAMVAEEKNDKKRALTIETIPRQNSHVWENSILFILRRH